MVLFLSILLVAVGLLFFAYFREINRLLHQLHDYNHTEIHTKLANRSVFRSTGKLAEEINQALKVGEKLREDAVRQDRLLRKSIGDLSHDLRTPLTVLQGYGELLETQPEQQQEYLSAMQQKCFQLTEIINAFAQWHQAEDPDLPLHRAEFDMTELLTTCLVEQAHLFRQAGVEPELELPEESVYCCSDQGACQRILENLLTNARKHTSGRIYVKLQPQEDGAELVIANEVEKMSPDEVPRLFQRFYQSDSARTKSGSGLGLAIVKALAEKLEIAVSAGIENEWLWVRVKF